MPFDPLKDHRRSIRWAGFDYSQRGLYFVTICTYQKHSILGEIESGKMFLSLCGEIVQREWFALQDRFPFLRLETFVVMPNHVHGILAIVERADANSHDAARREKPGAASSAPTELSRLARVVRAFKSLSAVAINGICHSSGKPVWQRNYYEHVIRGPGDLRRFQRYIVENPLRWEFDQENPGRKREGNSAYTNPRFNSSNG